jgi:predicted ribosome quality control (RQC) complex YloA/Tae2 family protein
LAEVGPGEAGRTLLETVAFTSAVNVTALLNDPDSYVLWERLRTLEGPDPCLLESERGKQPYPIVIEGYEVEKFTSILDALEAAAEAADGNHHPAGLVLRQLDRALNQARGKVRGLQRELEEAADPEVAREKANLILARLGEIGRGVSQVSLTGFLGETVIVDLDPTLSPHENAEALYREASRQQRARDRLPALLEKARAKVAHFEAVLEGVREGRIDTEEARDALPSQSRRERGHASRKEARLPFKRFRSSSGLEILVGRGPSDNDELTFRHARPDDIWLHAREAGGAHVVLRWSREDAPPGRDLSEAAVLAALNSRARNAGVVPVDWTRRKHVRKPRKAPPGTVRIDEVSTLFVEPDPGLPDRLVWDE